MPYKALYGHPDAGTYREQQCDAHVKTVGFPLAALSGHLVITIRQLSLVLSVYVDGFKMAGLKSNIFVGWKSLRQGLHIQPEQRINDKVAVYVGCRHNVSYVKLPQGGTATTMTYDMQDFLQSGIARYCGVVSSTILLLSYANAILG